MQIHLLGGVGTPGASCVVVEAAGRRVLVDAGTSAGRAPSALAQQIQALGGISAGVVTHAHWDHVGALPLILASFPRVPLITTQATLDLLRITLPYPDAPPSLTPKAAITATRRLNRVNALLARGVPLAFGKRFPLQTVASEPIDWWLTLVRAGHVLGAAMVLLETPEGTALISGDVSRVPQRSIPGAIIPSKPDIDVFVLESTFGGRGYRPREIEETRIVEQIRSALDDGGHVLIASSAIGVAQEILLMLAVARKRSAMQAKIYVDGTIPAVNAVYAKYAAEEYGALARNISEYGNPFTPEAGIVLPIVTQAEREAMLAGPPSIVISPASHLQSGPSAVYASELAQGSPNLILLPVQEKRPNVVGPLKAKCTIDGYRLSTHATHNSLRSMAVEIGAHNTILVHGTRTARQTLATELALHGIRCSIPNNNGTINMDIEAIT